MIELYSNSTKLIIEIVGYQFPFSEEYWDANWLIVRVKIYHNKMLYYAIDDPCLLTTDLLVLRNWFAKITASNYKEIAEISFMEPYLSFSVTKTTLKVLLKYNLNPNYEENFDAVYELPFEMNEKGFKSLIAEVDKTIKKFPEKTTMN